MPLGNAFPPYPAKRVSFVGREPELELLQLRLATAAKGIPATVVLGGEAGVGKSRLLGEFAERARGARANVLSGACIALGAGAIPYAPLIDALRKLVRQLGEEEVRRISGPSYSELAELISDFTGSGMAREPTSQTRVFGAILRLLDHIGAKGTAALIFEDLHWADPSTLDLMSYLARAQTDERMLLVCSYRDNDVNRRHPLWALLAEPEFRRRVDLVELSRFSEAELRTFLSESSGGQIDRRMVERLFELSGGNAFFAEELVVAGALADGESAPLPGSLTDLMLSRFEQLSDEAADVIQVAAVAGRRVSHRLLAGVSELTDRALLRALKECVAKHILVTDTSGDTYVFRHALLRETVYRDMLRQERVPLHAAIAKALTDDTGLGLAEDLTAAAELAYHWYAADAWPQALAAAVRAGGAAARLRAFREAEMQYERALKLWTRVTDADSVAGTPRQRVLAAVADAARWAGHADRAVAFIREALAEVDPARDARWAGELHERLGNYEWEAGKSAKSRRAYEEAARLLADQPPAAVTARVRAGIALTEVQAGHYADGARAALSAVEVARAAGARAEEGRALNTAGIAQAMLGQVEEGVENLRAALRIAESLDNIEDLFRAYANLAVALEHGERLDESVDVAIQGLAWARNLGIDRTRRGAVLANNASVTLVLLGRWEEAVDLIDDTLLGQPVAETLYPRLTRAEIEVASGRFAAAGELLAAVVDASGSNEDPRFLGPLHVCRAGLALWRRDLAAAREAVAEGIARIGVAENVPVMLGLYAAGLRVEADACGLPPGSSLVDAAARAGELMSLVHRLVPEPPAGDAGEVGVLWRLCGAEHARAGRSDDPAMWDEIAAAWDRMGRPYPAGYARWRAAEAAAVAGDRRRAATSARMAHDIAQRLGADPLRAEVEALARRARLDLTDSAEPGEVTAPARPAHPFRLTKRESEVLKYVSAGRTDKQISDMLHLSTRTVEKHVTNILGKMQVKNRTEAAAAAYRLGLHVDPDPGVDDRAEDSDGPSK